MTVVAESDLGWFVDHQLSIDDTYKCTGVTICASDIPAKEQRVMTEFGKESDVADYKCKPDLFAIWQPFTMDSHFSQVTQSQNMVLYFNGETMEKDTSSFLVERSETCAETESSSSAIFSHQKTEKVPAVPTSVDSYKELHMPLGTQLKIGTDCHKRKRKRRRLPLNVGEQAVLEEHLKICQLLSTALYQLRSLLKDTGSDTTVAIYDNNISARQAALSGVGDLFVQCCNQTAGLSFQSDELIEIKSIDCLRSDEDICNILIEQPHEKAVIQTLMGSRFILPPHCKFLLSDISRLEGLLLDETRYDCILIDPPWQNKSVKRKKTYATLADWNFLQLPVGQLCGRAALVLVWVTNKQQQQNFVKEYLFPKWNIKYLTKWYWLKVTKLLKPVCDLNTMWPSKRPYECILIGSTSSSSNTFEKIPQSGVIVSVPCSIHSRKPPLNEILQSYLPPNAKCLEMFARSLLPRWTSWGNEVLLYQHLDFFERYPSDTIPVEKGSVSQAQCHKQNSS